MDMVSGQWSVVSGQWSVLDPRRGRVKNPLSAKGREGARRTPLSTMGRLGREFEGTHEGCPYGYGRGALGFGIT